MEMKVIALYLPQFHRVKENDLWWGEGYTEWTAVKNAERLYENHYQPHIPLHDNYYDLTRKETMLWQAGLMKQYNIYGMCFYHYYFRDGRKILEKPAENLLKWKDVQMPFCFSWANETWARTWSKAAEKNSWNCLAEQGRNEEDDGVLLRQDYGREEDWEKHFNYLYPFFTDDRYIRAENKPVFVIYKPDLIPCLTQMMEKWTELAHKNGLEGIHFVATNSDREGFGAYLRQESNYSDYNRKSQRVDYDELCQKIVENAASARDNCYLCGFPGYDDTPRRGNKGEIIENSSPQKFYGLMRTLFWLGEKKGNEFTFVNAWNEWGEGMHLEPDEKYGYAYLDALKRSLSDYGEMEEGAEHGLPPLTRKGIGRTGKSKEDERFKKCSYYMRLFDKWLCLKERGETLRRYFDDKKYKRISIYGLGMTGNHLLADLEGSGIEVVYGIDKAGEQPRRGFPVYTLEEEWPEADAMVITVTHEFDGIYKIIKGRFGKPIVSLEEAVDYVESMTSDKAGNKNEQ